MIGSSVNDCLILSNDLYSLIHEQITEKFVWDNLNAQTFASLMCTDETCAIPDEAISLIDLDIKKALDIFNNCIKEKAECMKKQVMIKIGGS